MYTASVYHVHPQQFLQFMLGFQPLSPCRRQPFSRQERKAEYLNDIYTDLAYTTQLEPLLVVVGSDGCFWTAGAQFVPLQLADPCSASALSNLESLFGKKGRSTKERGESFYRWCIGPDATGFIFPFFHATAICSFYSILIADHCPWFIFSSMRVLGDGIRKPPIHRRRYSAN